RTPCGKPAAYTAEKHRSQSGRQLAKTHRKGNCIDNAATEQVFGHLKDEFHTGRRFASYEEFKNELDAYIIHWNTRRRQIRLEGHTPEEFRNMSLTA
ncbi:IS3 family transposase, partial [Bifidobacterium longum]|uniref:IS3 family transposase n=1 Tax=Bifidobacterium longum TaxID=216816 RepID=UPI00207A5D4A